MLLGGLMPPLAGDYWFMGETMPIFDDARLAIRLKLGLVFETGQLFNQLTVRENIGLPLRYHANLPAVEAEEKVQILIDELELGDWTEQTPGAIGRSIQKRVGLGRALILRPELLLLDNPLGGLDPQQIQWWLDFLRKLNAGHPLLDHRPLTVIASASDLRPWRACARQCAVLRGRSLQTVENWRGGGDAVPIDLVRELMPET
jgi:ABC-type transporter Mla maintaining outer membrane lipid asymmetry ATPase subunit MlaF